MAALMTAVSIWLTFHPLLPPPADPFSTDPLPIEARPAVWLINGLTGPLAVIGLALLALAWIERHWALLAYTLGYLTIGMVQGNKVIHSSSPWFFLPYLLVPAAVLLLGAAAFALFRPPVEART